MISAVVLTKNEEKNIKDCLKALQWCDEIVVIDDYSEDKTLSIAKRLGGKVYQRYLANDFAAQRNVGLKKAAGDWVLFLDADERVSAALAREIRQVIKSNFLAGFYLKRQDWLWEKALKHGETARVRLLRLAKKQAGEWQRKVHETWEIKGKAGQLKNPIIHYPHQTISEFLSHLNFHSSLHAEVLKREGIRPNFFRLLINPFGKFIQNYFFRLGFLDGMPGLISALMMSFHSFLARANSIHNEKTDYWPSVCFFSFLSFWSVNAFAFDFDNWQFSEAISRSPFIFDGRYFRTAFSNLGNLAVFDSKKKKYKLPPLAKPMFLFLLVALLSLIFNSPLVSIREMVVAGLYLLRLAVYFGFYFFVYDFKKSKQMLKFLMTIGVAMAVFGLVQYLLWPDVSALYCLGWDLHYYRIIGTFFDPGFTGIIYVLTLILLVVLNWKKLTQLKVKNFGFYCLLLVVYSALALTYSRSSYLAFLVAIGIIASVKKKLKFFLIILLVMVLTILILPRAPGGEGVRLERTTTVQLRFGSWQQALTIFRDHPLLGIGFNAYRYAQQNYGFLDQEKWQTSHAGAGADSSLLFVLATTGVIGFLVYCWLGLSVIRLTFKAANAKIGLVVLASVAALVCHSFFLNSLFYSWILAWLGIILGLL